MSSSRPRVRAGAGGDRPHAVRFVPRLLAFLAVSLALKLVVLGVVTSSDPRLFFTNDSYSYDRSARALVEEGVFAVSPERPEVPQTERTPGYPLLLAVTYAVFGERPAAVIAVQVLLSLVTIVLVYRLAAELWNPRVAVLAALLMTLDLASFSHSLLLLTETLFTLLIGCVLFCAARFDAAFPDAALPDTTRSWRKWALLLGLCLALATLVRPITYYLVLPLGAWVALDAGWRSRGWRQAAASLTLFAVPCVLLIGGWQLRNWRRTGSPDFSSIAGKDLLYYRGAAVVALRDGVSLEEARRQLGEDRYRELHPETRDWSDAQLGARWKRQGLDLMSSHPWVTARIHARGLASVLLATGEHNLMRLVGIPIPPTGPLGDLLRLSPRSYLERWLLNRPLEWAVFAGALGFLALLYAGAGVWLLDNLRRRQIGLRDLCFWGIFLYLLLVPSGPQANERFRVPVTPILCLYAAAGLSALGHRLRRGSDVRCWREPLKAGPS